MSIVDFPPLVSTSGLPEPIELGRSSYLERFKSSGRQASPTVSSRLLRKLLKEVKNGVVSSGITMEEEDSVPKSGLMPVKQYLIHQAKLSQSAPPVQPYRKSSSGLSQPKKVTFGSAKFMSSRLPEAPQHTRRSLWSVIDS